MVPARRDPGPGAWGRIMGRRSDRRRFYPTTFLGGPRVQFLRRRYVTWTIFLSQRVSWL